MTQNKFDVRGKKLIFEFENEKALNHFKSWMCESGEQEYWNWMEYREDETEEKNITGISFDYHNGKTIKVKCGRMDNEE